MADPTTTTVLPGAQTIGAAGLATADTSRPGERDARGLLRAGGEQMIEEARAAVIDLAEQQRRRAAKTIGGVAGALHRAATDLNAENETMARYTHIAAERLDDMARALRQTEWRDLVDGAENMARRRPYLFIGGAMAAGFVLARFLKSSDEVMGDSASSAVSAARTEV